MPTGLPNPPTLPHGVGVYTSPDDGRFYGACDAGDFQSPHYRDTKDEAAADVAQHVAEHQ